MPELDLGSSLAILGGSRLTFLGTGRLAFLVACSHVAPLSTMVYKGAPLSTTVHKGRWDDIFTVHVGLGELFLEVTSLAVCLGRCGVAVDGHAPLSTAVYKGGRYDT